MTKNTVYYSYEALNYLFGNWSYVEHLFDEIETLANIKDGLPDGDLSIVQEFYVWRVEQHEIFYQLDGLAVRVAIIRPLE